MFLALDCEVNKASKYVVKLFKFSSYKNDEEVTNFRKRLRLGRNDVIYDRASVKLQNESCRGSNDEPYDFCKSVNCTIGSGKACLYDQFAGIDFTVDESTSDDYWNEPHFSAACNLFQVKKIRKLNSTMVQLRIWFVPDLDNGKHVILDINKYRPSCFKMKGLDIQIITKDLLNFQRMTMGCKKLAIPDFLEMEYLKEDDEPEDIPESNDSKWIR